jgi:hypothetical protein
MSREANDARGVRSTGSGPQGSDGEHGFGRRQGVDKHGCALDIADLLPAQRQAERATAAVADDMKLGGQAAAAAPDISG